MRDPGLEAGLPYRLLALIVLAAFYAAYFGKLLAQRRRGIQTDQIGRRKERTLHRVEVLMKAATCAIVPAQLLSIGLNWSAMPAGARLTGFFVGLAGDGLFLTAALCMRDSWRAGIPEKDRTELVTSGIYAFSRNPAFLGFDLMYAGVLLMFFNPLVCLMTAFAVVMLHLQILQEEKYMQSVFGEAYLSYKRQVFRYLGRRAGPGANCYRGGHRAGPGANCYRGGQTNSAAIDSSRRILRGWKRRACAPQGIPPLKTNPSAIDQSLGILRRAGPGANCYRRGQTNSAAIDSSRRILRGI